MVDFADISEAMDELSPAALKLYIYFAKNQDNYSFQLSPKDFIKNHNVSESSYRRAKAELIEKGYLIQDGKNLHFYSNKKDVPLSESEYKEKINTIGLNLIKEGVEREIIEKIVLPAKNLDGKDNNEKAQIYKSVIKKLQEKANEYFSNDTFI